MNTDNTEAKTLIAVHTGRLEVCLLWERIYVVSLLSKLTLATVASIALTVARKIKRHM